MNFGRFNGTKWTQEEEREKLPVHLCPRHLHGKVCENSPGGGNLLNGLGHTMVMNKTKNLAK